MWIQRADRDSEYCRDCHYYIYTVSIRSCRHNAAGNGLVKPSGAAHSGVHCLCAQSGNACRLEGLLALFWSCSLISAESCWLVTVVVITLSRSCCGCRWCCPWFCCGSDCAVCQTPTDWTPLLLPTTLSAWRSSLSQLLLLLCKWPVFSHKLRYIVAFWLVEMTISPNQKPTIWRNLYENTDPTLSFKCKQQ